MGYLPERRGEVLGDLPAEPRRQAGPELAGLDGHGATASPATVSRSRSASTLSLQGVPAPGGRGAKSVAAVGSVRDSAAP
ncbi:MAG: hypothetical protein AVDCRST_MAG27-2308 [uncultured Craurococcus sp.]|uniref:Uncharacterized protein n=1 Tax=uncultured Craurococcus sp. TaxID=1135998 RepID=A0A6J4IR57_9PROT|nr:MAG: hypothetical protein AVDCRST_MAG27-2308 [uncultured Craurococcus sp.]